MNCARTVSVLCVILSSAISSTSAQGLDVVGFDPTPVRISSPRRSESRPVSSMDLLLIKDEKGVSISPDGKYVAFVVGQAMYETNDYRSGMYIVGTAPGTAPICLGTAGSPRWD